MNCDEIIEELRAVNRIGSKEMLMLQEKQLSQIVHHHYINSEFYRNLMKKNGIHPEDIASLDDITKLPIIEGSDIAGNFPFISVPKNEITRFFQTSGTTGKPKIVGYNKNDQERVAQVKARSLLFSGVQKHDVFLSVMAYGPWASGLTSQQGGEIIGLTIPADAKLGTKWHLWAISQYKPNYMVSLVSFLPRLLEECNGQNVNPASLGIKRMFVLGEISSETYREYFQNMFQTQVIDMYACTEFAVIASECSNQKLHYWADELLVEIINPETKEQCKKGERGEVVITGLKRESVPLIRYNTHDLAFLHDTPCECGSSFPTMSHILGRSDNMITVSGANLFPMQIEEALTSIPELSHVYNFIISKENFKDKVIIKAETKPGVAVDHDSHEALKQKIYRNFIATAPEIEHAITQAKTASMPEIIICKPGELSAGKWKIQKIFDEREKRSD